MTTASNQRYPESPKGRPLILLSLLLSVWVGSRLMMWEHPLVSNQAILADNQSVFAKGAVSTSQGPAIGVSSSAPADRIQSFAREETPIPLAYRYLPSLDDEGVEQFQREAPKPYNPEESISGSAGHQLVWMAAMAFLPVPEEIGQKALQPVYPGHAKAPEQVRTDRWSLDAWLFWRENGERPLISAGRAPTYGASQAGAVLNYRLAPDNGRDPRAYARIYRALIEDGEGELAAGVSARPIATIPLRAHAEVRLTEFETATAVRPAFFVTTELPRVALPFELYAEAYGQAGYVGGEASTVFADGQIHVLRNLTDFDLGQISFGGAAWAGAQEDAQRVDVGPSLRADLRVGDFPARVSIDYRERVAGDAEPPSGVAVTLSSRF